MTWFQQAKEVKESEAEAQESEARVETADEDTAPILPAKRARRLPAADLGRPHVLPPTCIICKKRQSFKRRRGKRVSDVLRSCQMPDGGMSAL